jgi:putative Mg2+ transporter-C (MgtC) family protein
MIALHVAAINLGVALSCGALIGSERQVRQRMAGLRTNALVALGAAGFVTFSQLMPLADTSPTRVAAQVVSGIGFLGAGIIFRDGFSVHGLNTAATLWCAAGVGLMAGVGAWPFALLLTGLVVFINLGLRPLVKLLKRYTAAGTPVLQSWQVQVSCHPSDEGAMRGLMLRSLTLGGLHMAEMTGQTAEDRVDLSAIITAEGLGEPMLVAAVHRLAAEPGLFRLRWSAVEEG